MNPIFTRIFLTLIIILNVTVAAIHANGPGNFDLSFAGKGWNGTNFGPGTIFGVSVGAQSDGKVVAAGNWSQGAVALACFNANGTIDTSFGTNGIASWGTAFPKDMILQPDGKIIVVGNHGFFGPDQNILVLRFNPNGSLDTTFAGDGSVSTDITSSTLSGAGGSGPSAGWKDSGRRKRYVSISTRSAAL